jgi:hypothetical protein
MFSKKFGLNPQILAEDMFAVDKKINPEKVFIVLSTIRNHIEPK